MTSNRARILNRPRLSFRAAIIFLTLWLILWAMPIYAQEYVELSPELDARAAALYSGIMCPQCNGQTISQSRAPIAETMREMVRVRLKAGDTDDQIYAFMVGSFGQSVLASPPTSGIALTVWVVPPIILLLGTIGVFWFISRLKEQSSGGGATITSNAGPTTDAKLGTFLDFVDDEIREGPSHG